MTLSGTDALVLEVCEGPRLVRIAQNAGSRLDLHCSAAGKILLTFALRPQLPTLVAQGLPVRTPHTLTTLPDLEAEIGRILGLGYAVDDEECYEGVRCLAAPVWDASGGTRAAHWRHRLRLDVRPAPEPGVRAARPGRGARPLGGHGLRRRSGRQNKQHEIHYIPKGI